MNINTNSEQYQSINLPESLRNEQTAIQDLHDIILLYQQAIHDVHQAIVDVRETSNDTTSKVKSITEQLHWIIARREDELLDEISELTASKIFALEDQFTKLSQRLMFCREARDEAEELLIKHSEYNDNNKGSPIKQKEKERGLSRAMTLTPIRSTKTRKRDHSGGSVVNYNARKDRIMAIVNKAGQDAKNEFEKELNRGAPIVNTRFHIEHYDITQQLETLGNIIEDTPLQQYQLYPPAITKTRAFKKSVKLAMKCREKIDQSCEHEVLKCEFEPQLVFVTSQEMGIQNDEREDEVDDDEDMMNEPIFDREQSVATLPEHLLNNPEKLDWRSLGWIELNPEAKQGINV